MWTLFFINAISIFGYATFTLHPELFALYPWSPPIYAVSYPLFARMQILLCFWLCIRACYKVLAWRWLVYFAPAFLISFLMEFGGTSYGIPFGKYSYTSLLGWQLANKVPVLIPISWFCMALCCYLLATQIVGPMPRRIYQRTLSRWQFSLGRIAMASLLLVSWDFTLEPAMSQLTPYWIWEDAGVFYFGVAVRNLLGWLVTGFLIFLSFEILRLGDYGRQFGRAWPARFYLLNLFLPVGLSIAGGAWAPVILTVTTLLVYCAFGLRRGTLQLGLLTRGTST
jgi:putative membrane protein